MQLNAPAATKRFVGSGGSRILCLGGLTGRIFLFGGLKGGLSAEGAKLRLPKARSPSRLGGLGERRRDFEHFKLKRSTFWDPVDLTFLIN